jgi:helix-turn-helix protein
MPSHGTRPGRPHDERDAFFRDLRALRARRGLDLSEIAERTRFPLDTLAAAETGPELPSLPALSAYLRGCGEALTSWEDRWRRLASGTIPAGDDLPVRNAGTSPLASAGAAVTDAGVPVQPPSPGKPAIPAQPAYTIKRLGHRRTGRWPAAFSRRYVAVTAGASAALLAVGGAALLVANQMSGHRATAVAGASPTPTSSVPGIGPSAQRAPFAPMPHRRSHTRGPLPWLEVAGVGCPRAQDDGVVLGNAPAGPGWAAAGGGWTGNGCDGSAVWTMNPNGNQPISSTLTWEFSPASGASHCTLAVFVPTWNAFGTGDYAIFTGNLPEAQNIATIPVNQAASAGQWITLGRYPLSGTSLEIQLAPATGTPGPPGPAGPPGPPGPGALGPGPLGRNHVTGVAPGYHAAIAASAASARCV